VSLSGRDLLAVIEEYAAAVAEKHYMDDQGHGMQVDAAHAAYDAAREDLLRALGIEEPRLVFRAKGRLHGDRDGQEVTLLDVESGPFIGVLFPDGARLLVSKTEVQGA
jgi:hypothetical protein